MCITGACYSQVALFALELPERNNEECHHIRTFRRGVDRTRDPVTQTLTKVMLCDL